MKSLLKINNLSTHFHTEAGPIKAVNDVSFRIGEGETVCIVGESGCGKSITAMSVMGLVEGPNGRVVNGQILFDGKDLLQIGKEELRRIRGNDISIISRSRCPPSIPSLPSASKSWSRSCSIKG